MRFVCTIYGHDYSAGGPRAWLSAEPVCVRVLPSVTVSGPDGRAAAARAYVRCVGRRRVRVVQFARGEADPKAIAASLRKTPAPGADCYQLDNLVEAWFIRVEPAPPLPRRKRLRRPLLRQLRQPSPN